MSQPLHALEAPMFVLWRVAWSVARTAYLATVCSTVGHNASWVLGAALGHQRPVCSRCKQVL